MRNLDALLRRIRSLLCVAAPNSGATDAEKVSARSLASRLIKANNLQESDIPERQVALPRPEVPVRPVRPAVVIVVGGMGGFEFQFNDSPFTNGNAWTSTTGCFQ